MSTKSTPAAAARRSAAAPCWRRRRKPSREEGGEATQAGQVPQDPSSEAEASRRTAATAGLIDQLAERGFGVLDDFVDAQLLGDLRARCVELHDTGGLRPAKVGRGDREQHIPEVRGDFIAWLQQPERDAEQRVLARLDELRAALNRALMTGLEDFQGHFALYPRGAGYARHFDRLVGTDVRAISAALYLNDGWDDDDGGQLRLYVGGGASVDVLPQGGRLVAFLSDRFEHEVLPAQARAPEFHRLVPAASARGLRVITLIVAVADNGVIGRDNALPWHLPEDLKRFKRLTMGKPMIMGRKTFESIGKPLPGRLNIVVTRDANYQREGVTVVHGVDAAIAAAADAPEVMVIGGADLFRLFLPRAGRIHLTRVHAQIRRGCHVAGAGRSDNGKSLKRERHEADERHAHAMTFEVWEKRK